MVPMPLILDHLLVMGEVAHHQGELEGEVEAEVEEEAEEEAGGEVDPQGAEVEVVHGRVQYTESLTECEEYLLNTSVSHMVILLSQN